MPWLLQRWRPWEAVQSWWRFYSWCVYTSPIHGATCPHHYAPSTCNERRRYDGTGRICRIQRLVPGRIPVFSTVQSTRWQRLLVHLFFAECIERICWIWKAVYDSFPATTVRQLRLPEHLELQSGILSSHLEKATLTETPKWENRKQFEPKTTCQLNNELELPAEPLLPHHLCSPSLLQLTSLPTVLDLLLNKGSDYVLWFTTHPEAGKMKQRHPFSSASAFLPF